MSFMNRHLRLFLLLCVFTLSSFAFAGAPILLTRQQAVAALLDPGSGVSLDLTESAAWSPFVDFGSGSNYEGLLPAGSTVDPFLPGDPGMVVATGSYFFWIDDEPVAEFSHPVRFALVDASFSVPTVGNGGIQVSGQDFWPEITRPGPIVEQFFDTVDNRVTAFPPGFDNPDGLVAGPASSPDDLVILPPAASSEAEGGSAAEPANKACALIINGHAGTHFANNVTRFENDLRNHYKVDPNRIVKANNGNPATIQDICDAIDKLCKDHPDCDKIFIRMASHGKVGEFMLSADPAKSISAKDLCDKFKKLAKKGVPICLLINACHSASLFDKNNWNFPAGSVILTSAASDRTSWGHATKFTKDGSEVNESLYIHAHSECLNDTTDSDGDGKVDADTNKDGTVDDCEAHEWVKKVDPNYTWTGNGKKYNPAGESPDGKPNPNPQKRTVGRDPKKININVQNATGAPKTDFHLVFRGDVRGGIPLAWQSDENDNINFGQRWARGPGKVQVGYDAEKDETMVCWIDVENPVDPNAFIHFGYRPPEGKNLKPLRQYWTPTAVPTPDPNDCAPTEETTIEECEDCGTGGQKGVVVRTTLSGADCGGHIVQLDIDYCISPDDIPLEELNLGSPTIQFLPRFPLYSGPLEPGDVLEQVLTIPNDIPPGHTVVFLKQGVYVFDLPGVAYSFSSVSLFDPLAPQPSCWDCDGQAFGDANGDGRNDNTDVALLHGSWLDTPGYGCCVDYNRDFTVDLGDLLIQAENFTRDDLGVCDSSGTCPAVCGDDICDTGLGEQCSNCPRDCGTCPTYCTDGTCDIGEDSISCAEDCGPAPGFCGDGFCENFDNETCLTCPNDCPPCDDIIEIPAGDDCWTTECGRTQISFCDNPIPADFFGPGSDPFDGPIRLGGGSLDGADTKVRRLNEVYLPPAPATAQVDIQITALSLTSCDPITVNINGQDTQWDVSVSLSEAPQPTGQMQIVKTHPNGGFFQSDFFVQPLFTFTRVGDPSDIRIFDTGLEVLPPTQMGTVGPGPWVHHLDIGSPATGCSINFVPGIQDPDQDATTPDQCGKVVMVAGRNVILDLHTPNAQLCPGGACFDSGVCGDVPNQGSCPPTGLYFGDGTDCRNTDGDVIPDILESNDCCANPDPAHTGTDPKNPDTDFDGQLDGLDPNPCTPDGGDICGDDVVTGLEVCDGTDLQGNDCISLGFDGGTLTCSPDCQSFDTSACVSGPVCGDGIAEGLEECDGTDLQGNDCASLGFDGGTLTCTAECTFDTSACVTGSVCGDDIAEGLEECDGTDLQGQDCVSLGFDGGTLTCGPECTFDASGCVSGAVCGDGAVSFPDEQCDGANLQGVTCESFGYDGGTLACNPNCGFDTSNCTLSTASCGDGVCSGLVESCHTCDQDCNPCDSLGDCCTETPGQASCIDQAVTECVCGFDAFCCETEWDNICVDEAGKFCGAGCSGGSGPCGNGVCDPFNEDLVSCSVDCYCGDGLCDPTPGENQASCPSDCPEPACGNGKCDPLLSEDSTSCFVDCFCGDGICNLNDENGSTCPGDCFCGDGICDSATEDGSFCPQDCASVPF